MKYTRSYSPISILSILCVVIAFHAETFAQQQEVKVSRILNSLGSVRQVAPEELRTGNASGKEIMGVLNSIDNKEELIEVTSLTRTVAGNEEKQVFDVFDAMFPAEVDGTADALLSIYEQNPILQEKSVIDETFSSMATSNILDYISTTYTGADYYDNTFNPFNQESSNKVLALNQWSMPKYDPFDFYRPVPGRITSNYGFRPSFGRMHKGVDISLNIGDTVRAALPGVVSRVSYEAKGYGNYIVVAHSNGMETRYAHLNDAIAVPGQRVMAGQPIGLGGNTGNSTGPHLHFEIRYMGTAMDPLAVFDFNSRNMDMFKRKGIEPIQPGKLATGLSGTKTSLNGKPTYVVRQGDTVKSVAKRAGISTLKLCQLNFITESTPLEPGRMLKLR